MATGDGRNQVSPNTTIDSDWGNIIADRVVQTYGGIAARDDALDSPADGAACYTNAEEAFWIRSEGNWRRMPWGLIAGDYGPDKPTGVSGDSLKTMLTVNFTARTDRRYLIQACVYAMHVNPNSPIPNQQPPSKGFSAPGVSPIVANPRDIVYLDTSEGGQVQHCLNNPQIGDVITANLCWMMHATHYDDNAWAKLSLRSMAGPHASVGWDANSVYLNIFDMGGV